MNICYLFSGQGSQFSKMGQDLYQSNPIYKRTVDEASETLNLDLTNPDIFDNPNNTQIAILTMSVAIHRILEDKIAQPVAMIGLSLGEYSALVAAKALSFQSGLKLVHDRSHYMDEAGKQNPGSMAAVLGLSPDFVKDVCEKLSDVYPANYNTNKQVVIGGTQSGVKKAMEVLTTKGAKRVVPLQVAVASHTPLMQPAADQLKQRLATVDFQQPVIPVISNTTVQPFDTATIKDTLVQQLTHPTHFMHDVSSLENESIDAFIEIGPGKTLSKLAKKTLKATTYNVENVETLNQVLDKLGE